jgi:cyclohexanone monooxygenase
MANGFPNCFFLGFTQGAITISVPQALGEQARHVAYLLNETRGRGATTLEPTADGEQAYVDEIHRVARLGTRFYTECTPGYYNGEGQVQAGRGLFTQMYSPGPIKFFALLEAWRTNGRLDGMAVG